MARRAARTDRNMPATHTDIRGVARGEMAASSIVFRAVEMSFCAVVRVKRHFSPAIDDPFIARLDSALRAGRLFETL
jgi:hypothetical protein